MSALVTPPEVAADDRARPGRRAAVTAIAATELRRISRDRQALFFVIVLPILIIVIIGATIGDAPRNAPVAVVDLDGSPASARVADALGASDVLSVEQTTDLEAVRRDLRTQAVVVGVVLEPGFGARVDAGEAVPVTVLATQSSQAAQPVVAVVRAVLEREGQALVAARVAAEQTGVDATTARAAAAAAQQELTPIEVRTESIGASSLTADNRYAYTAPSNLVLFVFINSVTSGAALVQSRQLGVTRRMLAQPVDAATVIGGFGATRLIFALLQSALILLVGRLAFSVDWGPLPAVVVLTLAFALVGTAAGLLVGAAARTPDQATAIGVPVSIGLAMLGGCMWPLEVASEPLQAIGHLTPHAWAMDGWITLIFDGGGLAEVLVPVLVLLGFAAVLGALAVARLRHSFRLGT